MANGCNQNPIGACSEAEGINTNANGTANGPTIRIIGGCGSER
jgi:hypothetical protein